MRRTEQDCTGITAWLQRCNCELNGVEIQKTAFGSGVVTIKDVTEEDGPLIEVPSNVVLSLRYIWNQAGADPQLKECLEALGAFTKSSRGAILVYLLLQISATSPDMPVRIGIESLWTTYVQYLPSERHVPTFWSDIELEYAVGTSLENATRAKMNSLRREFQLLHDCLGKIEWCQKYWLNPETGCLDFNDWKLVDAIYRSRAMELPKHGLCMVPIADMSNHAHEDRISARTDVDERTGNVRLVLDRKPALSAGREVTITYGEEKGACEMLFSYGFIDKHMDRAESIFLEMEDPEDDPIFMAKRHALDCAPGFRISYAVSSEEVTWIGPFIWLMCVNEEDGLGLRVIKDEDNNKRVQASWKGKDLNNVFDLDNTLTRDESWDLFRVRGYAIVQHRIQNELDRRSEIRHNRSQQDWWNDRDEHSMAWKNSERLSQLEREMLERAVEQFDRTINWLYTTKTVKQYFLIAENSEGNRSSRITNYTESDDAYSGSELDEKQ